MASRPRSSNRPAGAPSSELVARKIVPNSQPLLDPIKTAEAVKKQTVRVTNAVPVPGLHTTAASSQQQSRSLPKFTTHGNLSVNANNGEDNSLPLVLN